MAEMVVCLPFGPLVGGSISAYGSLLTFYSNQALISLAYFFNFPHLLTISLRGPVIALSARSRSDRVYQILARFLTKLHNHDIKIG